MQREQDAPEPWVDSERAAEHIGVSVEYMYAMQDELGIPRRKVGRRWRYRLSEIDAWMEEQMEGAA